MIKSSRQLVGLIPHPSRDWELDTWERRENVMFEVLPWIMLIFTAVATVIIRTSLREPWPVDLALCVLTAAWMAAERRLPPAWRNRGWVAGVYFTGLVILMAVLVYRDEWFGFFTFTGYFPAMRLSAGWARILGVAAIATLTGTSQAGGVPKQGGFMVFVWLACILVNLAVAGGFNWFGWVSQTQHEKRKTLVEELKAANERLETTLAENAGLHQQLITQAREAGILDERQRMAREIHDTLAQGLTGIITQLQAAEQASGDPGARRRHFDAATRLARDSLTEARRSVDALRPQPLEQARLSEALTSVAGRWSALHGVAAQVTVTGTARPMAADTELALLRTAQEALANVSKHAAASRVGVTLSYLEEEAILDVRDDGRGFDAACPSVTAPSGIRPPATAGGGGFGLVAMRERIEALSGTLQIESEPGAGTAISARVPFLPADAPPDVPESDAQGADPEEPAPMTLTGAPR
ncbi:MAG TPA: sensor histidine kinase [Trebonia sp.]